MESLITGHKIPRTNKNNDNKHLDFQHGKHIKDNFSLVYKIFSLEIVQFDETTILSEKETKIIEIIRYGNTLKCSVIKQSSII